MDAKVKDVPFRERFMLFAGFDWAKDAHDVTVVDPEGKVVLKWPFEDTAPGWATFRDKLRALAGGDLSPVAVAIETSQGPAVERLLDLGLSVYPLNPKAAERYRDRKAPGGGKSDPLDSWSFADALRTDGHGWRPLRPEDPTTQELRILCRDEVKLIEQRTALVLQLKEALHEYYPAALEAFDDWTAPTTWAFVLAFPSPILLRAAGKRRLEKFLHVHRLARPEAYEKRMELFARAEQFRGPTSVTNAKSLLATSLCKQLDLLQKQLHLYRAAIEKLFAQHPDHDVFGSLPGAGPKIAPRLLSEVGTDRQRFEDPQSLQCYSGAAPVTIQSGKNRWVHFRRACNKHLRAAVHLWADLSRHYCAWAQVYYQHKKDQGMSHACALRCLGQRWLKILWTMWQNRTPYNEALHTRNQVRHGSWVVTLTPSEVPVEPC